MAGVDMVILCEHGRKANELCPACPEGRVPYSVQTSPSRFDGAGRVFDNAKIVEDAVKANARIGAAMRKFDTGATRNTDEDKLDFEGFYSPLVMRRFSEYMHTHRKQADGALRASDNWQKGIPKDAYMKSGFRHFFDWWENHRGVSNIDLEEALCALLFNAQGYLFEILKEKK